MVQVDVTRLSGIGWLRAYRTEDGNRIAVLTLASGRRQLFVEDPDDPDSSQLVAELSVLDSHVLAELLGGPLLEQRADDTGAVAALLDWVHIPDGASADGASIAELRLRSATGASVVAVLRDDRVHADPDAAFRLRAHDVVVMSAGTSDLARGRELLTAPRGAGV